MRPGEILVEAAARPPLPKRRLEICEHKGAGHPDTLTDGACEAAAAALAGAYRQAFGGPMHFNVDKGLLVAGRSAPRFGGGEVLEPAKLVICGRAAEPNGRFEIAKVVTEAARGYLDRTLHRGAGNIRVECEVRRGSRSLEAVYDGAHRTANDTSFGAGFWPFSQLERTVLDAAAVLHSRELRARYPAAGDDFKIMGVRRDREIGLTVALAMVDGDIRSAAQYFETKHALARDLADRFGAAVVINTLDDPEAADESGLYLTMTGLSAEMGDDGQVGRGNRVNGLITRAGRCRSKRPPAKILRAMSARSTTCSRTRSPAECAKKCPKCLRRACSSFRRSGAPSPSPGRCRWRCSRARG